MVTIRNKPTFSVEQILSELCCQKYLIHKSNIQDKQINQRKMIDIVKWQAWQWANTRKGYRRTVHLPCQNAGHNL